MIFSICNFTDQVYHKCLETSIARKVLTGSWVQTLGSVTFEGEERKEELTNSLGSHRSLYNNKKQTSQDSDEIETMKQCKILEQQPQTTATPSKYQPTMQGCATPFKYSHTVKAFSETGKISTTAQPQKINTKSWNDLWHLNASQNFRGKSIHSNDWGVWNTEEDSGIPQQF